MIDRLVLVQLKEEFRTPEHVAEIASYSEDELRKVPLVRSIRAVAAAEEKTRQQWDLLLTIRLDGPENLEPFRVDPLHRTYVDSFLKPKLAQIQAWNFEAQS
jgi:hypothetical protein